ncbi:MAG: hypothetical protein A2252_04500 [Elusimicrobia bacterium RIFOXYA2_FULL_39_19]|nr:MAG: hypothetical protein A2252_04500 [Elusimicrobia bacterium RIFOXYA2_FULL_39_19]
MENTLNAEIPLSDFYLVCYLLTAGIELIRTEKQTPRKTLFVLRNSAKCQKSITLYFNNHAKVNPLAFKSQIINLKSLLYSQEGSCQR